MKVATTRYPTSRHNAMRPQSLIMLSFEHVAVVVVVSQKTGNSPKIKDQTRNGHHTHVHAWASIQATATAAPNIELSGAMLNVTAPREPPDCSQRSSR